MSPGIENVDGKSAVAAFIEFVVLPEKLLGIIHTAESIAAADAFE